MPKSPIITVLLPWTKQFLHAKSLKDKNLCLIHINTTTTICQATALDYCFKLKTFGFQSSVACLFFSASLYLFRSSEAGFWANKVTPWPNLTTLKSDGAKYGNNLVKFRFLPDKFIYVFIYLSRLLLSHTYELKNNCWTVEVLHSQNYCWHYFCFVKLFSMAYQSDVTQVQMCIYLTYVYSLYDYSQTKFIHAYK